MRRHPLPPLPGLTVEPESPATPDASALLDALSETLAAITGDSGRSSFDPESVAGAGACFVVARTPSGVAVGCGAFRPLQSGVAELKRMYAEPGTRGVGSVLLHVLECRAAALGYAQVWLETRLVNARAVAFYETHGYVRIPNFGPYVGRTEAVCLAKSLVRRAAEPSGPDRPAHRT